MGRGNLFPLDEDDLVKLYKGGMTKANIARHFGCAPSCIQKRLSKLGFPAKSPGVEQRFILDEDEIVILYNSGMTKRSIGKRFGCSELVIAKRLSEHGIPKSSTRSDAMRIRLARVGADGRSALSTAAHNAVRGMKRTDADLCKRALGKERAFKLASPAEESLYKLFCDKNIPAVPQKAVSKYNIDFAIGTVAVEISGRARKDKENFRERVKYLLDAGWTLIVIWAGIRRPITESAANYIISIVEQSSTDPSLCGQYRVIRGDGKFLVSGGIDNDDFPGVLSPVKGSYGRF